MWQSPIALCVFLNFSKYLFFYFFFRGKGTGSSPAQNAFPPGQELLLVLAAHCSMGGTVAAQLGSGGQVFLAPRSHVFSTKHLPYLGHQDCQVLAVFSFLLKFTALCGVKISPL